jgi:hypothetical protein
MKSAATFACLFACLMIFHVPAEAQTITPIADIQANPNAFQGQVVTVEGQVYIPTNYRGSIFSGYIQDASARGINLFGSGGDNALLFDTSNVVRVTGTVDLFFTTVEILDITEVVLVSSGNPPLTAAILSTGSAASPAWEGTFIESTGPITSAARGGPAWNYTTNDGSGPVVIRVDDALGAPQFSVGQTITGRGAGAHFQADFQILVGNSSDVFVGGGGPDTTPPELAGASGVSTTLVDVSFSESVTASTAEQVGNYEVFVTATPMNTLPISSATLASSGQLVALALGSALQQGTGYTVRVNNVEDEAGNVIAANSTVSFTFSTSPITAIADIHADLNAFLGQVVTIQAQVYIATNYRSTIFSGYVQDSSQRGINLFGGGANNTALFDTSNIVRLTGTVEIFFSTVEIVDITDVTLVSSGNPPLTPAALGTGAAANTMWEGTFIEASGTISTAARGGPGWNYTIDDGSGPVTIRVIDDVGASELSVGEMITGRGAGSQFQTEFQILVGDANDVFATPVHVENATWSRMKEMYR